MCTHISFQSATIKTSISYKHIPAEPLFSCAFYHYHFHSQIFLRLSLYFLLSLICTFCYNLFIFRQLNDERENTNSVCVYRDEGGKGGDPEFIKVGPTFFTISVRVLNCALIYRTSSRRALTLMNSSRSTSLSGANSAARRRMTSRGWRTSRPSARYVFFLPPIHQFL